MDQYDNLSPQSRVWIYQSNRPLSEEETNALNIELADFAASWTSHNQQLHSFAKVYHQHFIVLMVDETQAGASGCSIDKSVHFIQRLQQKHNLNLMDRMCFAYRAGTDIKLASAAEFNALFAAGEINKDSQVFDNLIKTKADLETEWEKKLADSWHMRFV